MDLRSSSACCATRDEHGWRESSSHRKCFDLLQDRSALNRPRWQSKLSVTRHVARTTIAYPCFGFYPMRSAFEPLCSVSDTDYPWGSLQRQTCANAGPPKCQCEENTHAGTRITARFLCVSGNREKPRGQQPILRFAPADAEEHACAG